MRVRSVMTIPKQNAPSAGPGQRLDHLHLANAKAADIGPAALGVAPGLVESLTAEGMLDRKRRLRVHTLGQWRIVRAFVAASLVVFGVQAARFDLGVARPHL